MEFEKEFTKVFLNNINDSYSDIIFACIGTDKSLLIDKDKLLFDIAGPLVGSKLHMKLNHEKLHIIGTIGNTLNRKNLPITTDNLLKLYINPFVIAIDSCIVLRKSMAGKIIVKEGALYPRRGIEKQVLPPIGNISIKISTAYWNRTCSLNYSLINELSDTVTEGITNVMNQHIENESFKAYCMK